MLHYFDCEIVLEHTDILHANSVQKEILRYSSKTIYKYYKGLLRIIPITGGGLIYSGFCPYALRFSKSTHPQPAVRSQRQANPPAP
jgi:hypothetical protein